MTKCPNCGAPLAPNISKCSYCGSVISDAPDMSWTRVDRQLPPADPDHPGRSVYVITLRLGDGLTFVSKKEKKTYYWYDFQPRFLISAYYDFNTEEWANELLGPRHEEIIPTHWMPIPPKSSSAWIAASDRLPPPKPEKDGTAWGSIEVLVCDQAGNFPASVTIGNSIRIPFVHWKCYGLSNVNTNDINCYEISATHWMLRPAVGPKE